MNDALRLARSFREDEVADRRRRCGERERSSRARQNQVELLRTPRPREMLALTQAEAAVGDWRLNDCDLYVTKEPCPMCAGALVPSGCGGDLWMPDPRGGAAGGVINLLQMPA